MVKLYTHNDLDGIGCAVLANLAFGHDVDIEIVANPQELTNRLCKSAESGSWKTYNLIYITDMSFDVTSVDKRIVDRIRLFDHHQTAAALAEQYDFFDIETERNGRLTCGTELWHNFLVKKNLIQSRNFFVEQIRLYDTWDWTKGISKIPQYMTTLLYELGQTYFLREFSNRLRKDDVNELSIFNELERNLLLAADKRNQKEVKRITDEAWVGMFESGTQYAVVLNGGNESSVGNELIKRYDVDIAIMANLNRGRVSFRSQEDGVNVGDIAKEKFDGGGHQASAGGMLDTDFTEGIVRSILEKIDAVQTLKKHNA